MTDDHIPDSLDDWLNQWVVEHKSFQEYEPIIRIKYQYLLEGVYRN